MCPLTDQGLDLLVLLPLAFLLWLGSTSTFNRHVQRVIRVFKWAAIQNPVGAYINPVCWGFVWSKGIPIKRKIDKNRTQQSLEQVLTALLNSCLKDSWNILRILPMMTFWFIYVYDPPEVIRTEVRLRPLLCLQGWIPGRPLWVHRLPTFEEVSSSC